MSDFDEQMRRLFSRVGAPDAERTVGLREEVISMYDERLKKVERRTRLWIWITVAESLVGCILLTIGLALSVKVLIVGVMLILGGIQFQVLVKLWYWMMNTKLNVLKEIQDLRLQMLEERQKGQGGTEGAPGGPTST
jgi:hypothetical protein